MLNILNYNTDKKSNIRSSKDSVDKKYLNTSSGQTAMGTNLGTKSENLGIVNKNNKSYQINHIRTNSSSLMSRNSNLKNSLSNYQTEYKNNIETLEKLIKKIKYEGFDKLKTQIESKTYAKAELEARVETLQNQLNAYNSQKKKYGMKNLAYEQMTSQSLHMKEVSIRII